MSTPITADRATRAARLRIQLADLEISDSLFLARAGVEMRVLRDLRHGRAPHEHNLAALERTHQLLTVEKAELFSERARRCAQIAEQAQTRYGIEG